jgi:hypothetical protein
MNKYNIKLLGNLPSNKNKVKYKEETFHLILLAIYKTIKTYAKI